jgi:hypothetical protein
MAGVLLRWNATGKAGPKKGRANTMAAMGLNPFRQQRRTLFDLAMMVAALAAALAAVVWAVLSS